MTLMGLAWTAKQEVGKRNAIDHLIYAHENAIVQGLQKWKQITKK
jgi:hypothetical protein